MRFFRWLRWLFARCPLLSTTTRDNETDRRIVSPEARARYETHQRERADVERRLELVEMQAKVIAHVTNGHTERT